MLRSEVRHRSARSALLIAAAVAVLAPSVAMAQAKVTEKDVIIATPDGKADAVVYYPAKGKGPWPEVILWHDLSGLRPVFRDMGRKLAGEGFVVLTPNAFYRSGKASGETVNLRDPEIRKRQMGYRAAATDDGITRDAVAFLGYLDTLKQSAKTRKAGAVGFDVGGGYAFRTAAAMPDRIAAVASIHGLGVATERPNSPHLLVPKTKAAYFVVQSKDDDAREPGDKEDYRKVIDEGKLTGTVEVYPANHGFAIADSANYDAASAGKAWTTIVALLKSALK